MSHHLSEDQISALVAGDYSGEAAAHLGSCALCRRHVEQLESVLGHFRGAVREWSDLQFAGIQVQPRTRLWPSLAYSLVVACVVLLSVIGYRFATQAGRKSLVPTSVAQSDTLLLNHVNADVSRSVPPGMETLLGFTATQTEQR